MDANVKNLQGVPEILDREAKEEERVRMAEAEAMEKEEAIRRKLEEERAAAVSAARAGAKEELEKCRDEELPAILRTQEEARQTSLSQLEGAFKKKSPAIVKKLLATMRDTVFPRI